VSVIFDQTNHSKDILIENMTNQVDFSFTGRGEVQLNLYDGSVASGVEVSLYNYLEVKEANSITDSMGLAVFEELNVHSDYFLSFLHKNVPYSNVLSFNDSYVSPIVFNILEGTTDDEDFKVFNHHVVINTRGSGLNYWEQATYFNMGYQVFNTSWLNGWIPADATDITHDTMDCCIQFLGQGDITFDPMDPLFPEDYFSIELKYSQSVKVPTQLIEKKVIYDTETMFFLIEEKEDVTFEAIENIEYNGIETFGDTRYLRFEGTNLIAGDIIRLEMNTNVSVFDLISSNPLIWGPIVLGVPMGLIYLYVNNKEDSSISDLEDEKREIFESLARAERDLEEHKITKKDFEKLRVRYKRKTIQILKKIYKSQNSRTTQEEKSLDYISDLKAVEAVITSINKDREDGTLSEDSYQAIISKYELKRINLIKKIRESVKTDIEKGDGEQE
jgi:hypothetical protein